MPPTSDYTTIDLRVDDGLARLRLNRPQEANAVSGLLAAELRHAAIALRWDPAVRAVLLSASGKVFCGGGDLAEFAGNEDGLPVLLATTTSDLHAALATFAAMDAPLVAAVGGSAGGAGLSLVAAADLVVASTRAKFTMGYTAVGLTPDGSSSFYLSRAIGLKRAMDLVLTNRVLTAEDALAWGLVNRVVGEDDLDSEAERLARSLAEGPTASLGAAKRLLIEGANLALVDAMQRESEAISVAGSRADAKEGVAAFLGKRRPSFRGR